METIDCAYLLEGRDPSRILKKTIALFENQITENDSERQIHTMNVYMILSKNGYVSLIEVYSLRTLRPPLLTLPTQLLRDLTALAYLFELMRLKLPIEPAFVDTMDRLLDLCAKPPILIKSLDLLNYADDLEEYFTWLGYMILWSDNKRHQSKTIAALYSLLTSECREDKRFVSLERRKENARSSKLPDILGELLQIVDDHIYLEILNVVHMLIDGSKATCVKFLTKNVVSTIIVRLEPRWRERYPSKKPEFPKASEEILQTDKIFFVLTTLLPHADKTTMKAPTKYTLWSLQWAFRLFTSKETTATERNNVLAVLLLLMDIYPDLLLGSLTFSYDIAMLAMSSDIIFHPNWTTSFRWTSSHEDHCFMSLLLMCISYFPNCLSGPKVIEECRVVMGLLKLIGHQQSIKWLPLQACNLIKLALNVLHKIVPVSIEEFIEDGGPLVILQLLNRARDNRDRYSFDIIYRSIDLLAELCFKFKSISDSVAYNGGLECVLGLSKDLMTLVRHFELDDQMLLLDSFCLLEQICEVDQVLKVLPTLVLYMKRYINPSKMEYLHNPKLIIACLSFIWNKVACKSENAVEFVKMSGIYLMLDIAEMSCMSVRMVVFGTLIDMCEKAECIPYMITWRRRGKGIKSLLLETFREENKQLEVRVDDDGVIRDHLYPLMGHMQFDETYCLCKRHIGNAAIADVFISCRPKVYCLLQILNVEQHDTVEIANETYKVYDEELSIIDEVTNVLAENFLALKLSEEWKEIKQDFTKHELDPVPMDANTLNNMVRICDKWSKDVQQMQRDILKKHQLKDSAEEQALYNTLIESCLGDAWTSLCEMKYIARCSERLFRITSNFNLHTQLTKSLHFDGTNGKVHRTVKSDLSVLCMNNQSVSITSDESSFDDIAAKKTDDSPALVSPICSNFSTPRAVYEEFETEYLPEKMIQYDNKSEQYSESMSSSGS